MPRFWSFRFAFLLTAVACAGAARAASGQANAIAAEPAPFQVAQSYEQPPAVIPGVGDNGQPQPYGQPQSQDAAALLVRIDRLEDQVRTLNGQIQDLQFNQKRLENDLIKFQQDVDFRFRDSSGSRGKAPPPGKRADAGPGSSSSGAVRDDAFNPALDPDAKGAPRVLGQLPSTGAAAASAQAAGSNAPLDLGDGPQPSGPSGSMGSDQASSGLAGPLTSPQSGDAEADGTVMAGLPPAADPRADFDLALVSFNNGQFTAAESGFRSFLDRHPKNGLTPEALFYLGESYWKTGRTREAAEQYLKVSTDYATSSRAPESLLKLGLSLEKLGSRGQACASWGQIARKYPNAPAAIRASASRDIKRDQC